MDEKIKYLIFFILGIALYSIFKRGLVEGLILEDLESDDWKDDGEYIVNHNMGCNTEATPSDSISWLLSDVPNSYEHRINRGENLDVLPKITDVSFSTCKTFKLDPQEASLPPAGLQYYSHNADRRCKLLTEEELSSRFTSCNKINRRIRNDGTISPNNIIAQKLALRKCTDGKYRNFNGLCITNSDYELLNSPNSLLDPDTSGDQPLNYDKRNIICSVDRTIDNCEGESAGWNISDIRTNYKNKGVKETPEQLNTCRKVDKLCFENEGEKAVTTLDQCKNMCDSFGRCGSFSFYPETNSDSEVDNNSTCCLYTTGYKGYERDLEGEGFNCYTKKDCVEGEKYYSFKQCEYTNPEGQSALCGSPLESSGIFTYSDGTCSSTGSIQQCTESGVEEDDYCKCNEQNNICLQSECENELCSGTISADNNFCSYGTNDVKGRIQDTDIINEECSCGLYNPNLNTFQNEEQRRSNNILCNSTEEEHKYCSFIDNQCKTLDDCNSSGILLTESCGYTNETGEKQICKYTDENGLMNNMYNENFPVGEQCKTIIECSESQMDRILEEEEYCLCPNPGINTSNLCSSGKICSNASGCHSRTLSCPENLTYDEESNSCLPNSCTEFNPNTNKFRINENCICETDLRSENFICEKGNYCLPSNAEYSGCRSDYYLTDEYKLKESCKEYSETNTEPIEENCFCGQREGGEPATCKYGKYCVDGECKDISCEDEEHIIDPSDHTKCISRDILEKRKDNIIVESTNKVKSFFDNLLK